MEQQSIQYTSRFQFMGTIEKVETFNSKGGGLTMKVQTGELEKAVELIGAKGKVLRVTVEISTQAAGEDPDDGDQLTFDEVGDDEI